MISLPSSDGELSRRRRAGGDREARRTPVKLLDDSVFSSDSGRGRRLLLVGRADDKTVGGVDSSIGGVECLVEELFRAGARPVLREREEDMEKEWRRLVAEKFYSFADHVVRAPRHMNPSAIWHCEISDRATHADLRRPGDFQS